MSVNLPLRTVEAWLHYATGTLSQAGIGSARLDAELLLADILHHGRAWILAHPEQALTSPQREGLKSALALRARRIPLAYIRGFQEFYGRRFAVDARVLIPRPESEAIVSLVLGLTLPAKAHVLDVGTGSGCLGITVKLERPAFVVTLSDAYPKALEVARQNAANLGATVTLEQSDLLAHFLQTKKYFDVIIANLPYVAPSWKRSPETKAEPAYALFAEANGLALIYQLIEQAIKVLSPDGFLIIEADVRQHKAIQTFSEAHQFKFYRKEGLALGFCKA